MRNLKGGLYAKFGRQGGCGMRLGVGVETRDLDMTMERRTCFTCRVVRKAIVRCGRCARIRPDGQNFPTYARYGAIYFLYSRIVADPVNGPGTIYSRRLTPTRPSIPVRPDARFARALSPTVVQ